MRNIYDVGGARASAMATMTVVVSILAVCQAGGKLLIASWYCGLTQTRSVGMNIDDTRIVRLSLSLS